MTSLLSQLSLFLLLLLASGNALASLRAGQDHIHSPLRRHHVPGKSVGGSTERVTRRESITSHFDTVMSDMEKEQDNTEQRFNKGLQGTIWPLDKSDNAQNSDPNQAITSKNKPDSLLQSPPFYPTPRLLEGRGAWKDAVAMARAYVQNFTLEERVTLVTGVGFELGPKPRCLGNIAANNRTSFPGLCLEDSPTGVRYADLATVYPAAITAAATFSPQLLYERGKAMGSEHRAKGVNVVLGPAINMHRNPAAGRNFEFFGADPYLSGEAAFQTIRGLQSQGVQACAKHLVGNDQEANKDWYSTNMDDKVLREIYLHPFMRSIQADVASIMCSYNLLNNSWACQNSYLLNRIVKTELGFQGFVVSDWGAQHSGVASALAGLDMTMPGQIECCSKDKVGSYWSSNLTQAVKNGSVDASRLEDMCTRILASWYMAGQDSTEYPRTNFDAFDSFYGDHSNVVTNEHSALAREIAAAGTVLLKNVNSALPLRKNMRKVSIVGQDAAPAQKGSNYFRDRGGVDGVVPGGWGSGTADYSYLISPYEALQERARTTNTGFYWTFDNFATGQAMSISDQRLGVDAAIVFVHADSGEAYIRVDGNVGDRKNLTLWANGDNLILNVSSVQSNTIVVIHGPGQVDMEQWIDNPNVTAVIHAHIPGSEAGNAIADILYGDVTPSGRLPYTIAKQHSDYASDVIFFTSKDTASSQLPYDEKLQLDYRYFDANNIEPRFAFGYGLSYTSFAYSNLTGRWTSEEGAKEDWNARDWTLPIPDWLFEDVYEMSFDIANTGSIFGYEVPQVYLGFSASAGEPPKVLRKFDRLAVDKGDANNVNFTLNRYDLSVWDSIKGRWSRPEGDVSLYVGASSRDIRLTMDRI